MPKAKEAPPAPTIPYTEYERTRLIVQLRHEIASDSAKAFRAAAQSNLTPLPLTERTQLFAIAEGYELQARLLKSTLDLGKKP